MNVNVRPSKRPKVGQVSDWVTVFTTDMEYDWRGLYGGVVIVQRGNPFPDFYKVRYKMGYDTKWQQKLFYGEMAYHKVVSYVADLGFRTIYSATLY